MFSFLKKQAPPLQSDFFPINADMHSHILPGIDDGSPDIKTSLLLIEGMMKMGIKTAVATPHIIGDLYRNNADTINSSLLTLNDSLRENQIDFKVKAAAEYMLDDYFLDLLRTKTPLLTVKDKMILTEFSYSEKPHNIEQITFNIITEGYEPILAHPERYAYYYDDYKEYHHLKDLGFLLQVNLLSLTGYYGKSAAKAGAYMLKNNLVSFAGTDLHHERHMNALYHPPHRILYEEAFSGKMMNEELLW